MLNKYNTIQMFEEVFYVFERNIFSSPKLHLFDPINK